MVSASGAGTRTPGQDEVHGPPVPDDAREADRAQVAERHAEAAAEDPEDRVLGGHPQVAPERQLDAPGHGVALDGGDHGLARASAGSGPSGPGHGPGWAGGPLRRPP